MLSRARLLAIGASLVLVLTGLLLLCGSSISLATLQGWAASVRRAGDMTPDRHERFRHLCIVFGLGTLTYGAAGLVWNRRVGGFLERLGSPVPSPTPDAEEPATDPLSFPGERVAFGLVLLVGIGVRLAVLDQPMAYDEAYSYRSFARHSFVEAIGELNSANNHLLNTVGMFVAARLFGPAEWALRLPVFLCGVALLPLVFLWARRQAGGGAAIVAMALAAVSPLMISYSADARGYMYVALAAVLFDGALRFLDSSADRREWAWIAAWLAVIFGLWAMILMAFPIVGGTLWYVLLPLVRKDKEGLRSAGRRLGEMTILGALTLLPVLALYSPGYVIRGLQLFQDPVIGKVVQTGLWSVGLDWLAAAEWWVAGFIPPIAWIAFGLLGLSSLWRSRGELFRWPAPFLVMFAVNAARGLHPPPRTFLWLMPWVAVLVGRGVGLPLWRSVNTIFRERPGRWGWTRSQGFVAGATGLVLITGLLHVAMSWPVLFFASERRNYVSIPELIGHLAQESRPLAGVPQRLIAPLPCDLPSLFYLSRQGIDLPVNGDPQPGEVVWLIARTATPPEATLRDGLVQLGAYEDRFETWTLVWHFDTLDLYRSRLRQ